MAVTKPLPLKLTSNFPRSSHPVIKKLRARLTSPDALLAGKEHCRKFWGPRAKYLSSLSPSAFSCKREVAVETKHENVRPRAQHVPSEGDSCPSRVNPQIWAQCSEGTFCLSRGCLEPIRTQLFSDSVFLFFCFFIYSLSSIQHGHEWGIAGTPGSKIGKAVLGSSLVALIKVPPTSSPLLGICVVPARV